MNVGSCRDEALKVVLDFTSNPALVHVACLLYQLEVLLLHSTTSSKKVRHSSTLSPVCRFVSLGLAQL